MRIACAFGAVSRHCFRGRNSQPSKDAPICHRNMASKRSVSTLRGVLNPRLHGGAQSSRRRSRGGHLKGAVSLSEPARGSRPMHRHCQYAQGRGGLPKGLAPLRDLAPTTVPACPSPFLVGIWGLRRGRSSEVERQLPKLNVGGSIPPARSIPPPLASRPTSGRMAPIIWGSNP